MNWYVYNFWVNGWSLKWPPESQKSQLFACPARPPSPARSRNRIWGTTHDVLRSCRRANLDLHCLLAKGKDFIWSQAGTSGTNLVFRHLNPFWAFWAFWTLTSHEANQQLPSCANQILAVLCTESSPLDLASWDSPAVHRWCITPSEKCFGRWGTSVIGLVT